MARQCPRCGKPRTDEPHTCYLAVKDASQIETAIEKVRRPDAAPPKEKAMDPNPDGWSPVEIHPRTPKTAPTLLHHRHNIGAACTACEIVALRKELAERSDVTAPPSDTAQPVAWRYRDKAGGPGWLLTASPTFYEPEKYDVKPLYAHPEVAPEGPWEVRDLRHADDTTFWNVKLPDTNRWIGDFSSEAEAIAVCDALNRLKGDEKR